MSLTRQLLSQLCNILVLNGVIFRLGETRCNKPPRQIAYKYYRRKSTSDGINDALVVRQNTPRAEYERSEHRSVPGRNVDETCLSSALHGVRLEDVEDLPTFTYLDFPSVGEEPDACT